MEVTIPEIESRKLLLEYTGANNYILEIKDRCKSRYYKLSRNQSEYIIEHKNTIPKIARKWVKVDTYYGLQLQEKKLLTSSSFFAISFAEK